MIEKEFEDLLKKIFFHIARYGAVTYASEKKNPEEFDSQRFFELCNEGFKIAQMDILSEIKILQSSQRILNKEIKEERRKRNKEKVDKLISSITIEKYKEEILRNLAFTIVWQIFDGKREIIARFYTGERGSKEFEGKGFDAILQVASEINKFPNRFALISDLTNNIQVGDLLVIYQDKYEIIEVKTGKKNEEANRVLNFYKVNNIEPSKERLEKSFDQKFVQQVLRIQKQIDKTAKVKKIVETDQGEDPKHRDTRVKLVESPVVDQTYHNEIIELFEKLNEKDWAYTSITGIINVGVYKNDWRIFGREILKEINSKYPVYDLTSSLGINISEPIFAKPFKDDIIIDLALGKIKLYIGIDFDKFIEFCNDFELPVRWSTTKEFGKFVGNSKFNTKEIFSYNNKGLIIEDQETKGNPMFVGYGMLFKMIFDHIRPETLVLNRKLGFDKLKQELKQNKK